MINWTDFPPEYLNVLHSTPTFHQSHSKQPPEYQYVMNLQSSIPCSYWPTPNTDQTQSNTLPNKVYQNIWPSLPSIHNPYPNVPGHIYFYYPLYATLSGLGIISSTPFYLQISKSNKHLSYYDLSSSLKALLIIKISLFSIYYVNIILWLDYYWSRLCCILSSSSGLLIQMVMGVVVVDGN